MKKFHQFTNGVAAITTAVTAVILVSMVTIISWQVISRFFLNRTPFWSEETTLLLMIYFGFLGAPIAYRERLHIGIVVFLEKMPGKMRRWFFLSIDLILGLFSLFMIAYGSQLALRMMHQNLPALPIAVGYSYLAIPLGGAILFLFVLEKILQFFSVPKGA